MIRTILIVIHDWLVCLWNLIQLLFSVGRIASGLGNDFGHHLSEDKGLLEGSYSSILQHMWEHDDDDSDGCGSADSSTSTTAGSTITDQQFLIHNSSQQPHSDLSRSISIKISNINHKLSLKEFEWKRSYRRHTIVGVCLGSPMNEITTRNSMDSSSKLTSYGDNNNGLVHTSSSKDDIHTLMNHYLDPREYRKAISYPISTAELKISPRTKRTTICWKLDRSELVLHADHSSLSNKTPKCKAQQSDNSSSSSGKWKKCPYCSSSKKPNECTTAAVIDSSTTCSNNVNIDTIQVKGGGTQKGIDFSIQPSEEYLHGNEQKSTEPKTETLHAQIHGESPMFMELNDRSDPKFKTRSYLNENNLDETLTIDGSNQSPTSTNFSDNTATAPHAHHHHNYMQNFTKEEILVLKDKLEHYKFP